MVGELRANKRGEGTVCTVNVFCVSELIFRKGYDAFRGRSRAFGRYLIPVIDQKSRSTIFQNDSTHPTRHAASVLGKN